MKLEKKKSKIHGYGLFAKENIRKGSVLGYITTKPTKKEGPYTLWINNKIPVDVTCQFKYINHSDHPNCAYYDDGSVVALKAIKKGQELTHYYGDE